MNFTERVRNRLQKLHGVEERKRVNSLTDKLTAADLEAENEKLTKADKHNRKALMQTIIEKQLANALLDDIENVIRSRDSSDTMIGKCVAILSRREKVEGDTPDERKELEELRRFRSNVLQCSRSGIPLIMISGDKDVGDYRRGRKQAGLWREFKQKDRILSKPENPLREHLIRELLAKDKMDGDYKDTPDECEELVAQTIAFAPKFLELLEEIDRTIPTDRFITWRDSTIMTRLIEEANNIKPLLKEFRAEVEKGK